MSIIIPASRPKQTREVTLAILAAHGLVPDGEVMLLGVRGYYGNTFGGVGNDKDVYDDALFVISPDVCKPFNFNTDPSKQYGSSAAMIDPGKYPYYRGAHHIGTPKAYKALRPHPEGVGIPCTRHGVHSIAHATNIHKGGMNVTGSAGCQTIPPNQYQEAMLDTIYRQMSKYNQHTITYLLIESAAVASPVSDVPASSGVLPKSDNKGTQGNPSDSAARPPTLQKGKVGQAVRRLQQALNAAGEAIDVDASFGKDTEAAVMRFQRKKGLTIDGVVGPSTWKALEG